MGCWNSGRSEPGVQPMCGNFLTANRSNLIQGASHVALDGCSVSLRNLLGHFHRANFVQRGLHELVLQSSCWLRWRLWHDRMFSAEINLRVFSRFLGSNKYWQRFAIFEMANRCCNGLNFCKSLIENGVRSVISDRTLHKTWVEHRHGVASGLNTH